MTNATGIPKNDTIRWQGLSFGLAKGLADETVLTFVEDVDGPARYNLTVARDDKAGSVEAYVAEQRDELLRTIPGIEIRTQEQRSVAGRTAILLEQSARSNGRRTIQLQAYVDAPDGVVIVTATCAEGATAVAREAFEHLLGTLTIG